MQNVIGYNSLEAWPSKILSLFWAVLFGSNLFNGNPENFAIVLLLFIVLSVIAVIKLMYLKPVQAHPWTITFNDWGYPKEISYKDVVWIFEQRQSTGFCYGCIKFYDNDERRTRYLMFTSDFRYSQWVSEESAIVQYIRERIMLVQPNYYRDREPSSWWFWAFLIAAMAVVAACT